MRSHLHKDGHKDGHKDRQTGESDSPQQETTDLKAQLETLCQDLWWSSESDYPVEVVWQLAEATPVDIDKAVVRKLGAIAQDVPIQLADVEDFFDRQITPKSWHTEEDKAQLVQLQTLKDLLVSNLSNFQVYRCGEVEIKVYAVGNDLDGRIAGVKTTLVET